MPGTPCSVLRTLYSVVRAVRQKYAGCPSSLLRTFRTFAVLNPVTQSPSLRAGVSPLNYDRLQVPHEYRNKARGRTSSGGKQNST